MKNAFLNLGVPSLQLSEPAPPPIFNVTKSIAVSIWDRWDVHLSSDSLVKELFVFFEKEKGLNIFNIFMQA